MFKDKDHSLNEEFRVIDIFYSSQTLTAPIFDWYFINFAYYLCNMNEIDRNIKTALQSESDDFHF